jgi:hypothetical protein
MTRRLVLCSAASVLLCAALIGCSWHSLIILFHSVDQAQCQAPPKLPQRISWRNSAALVGRPISECPGTIAYSVEGSTQTLFFAKFHKWTEHLDTLGDVTKCTLITVSSGTNLPSGPLKKEDLDRAAVRRAITEATEFSQQLSSLPGFPAVISGYAGEIARGWDLAADLPKYCRH